MMNRCVQCGKQTFLELRCGPCFETFALFEVLPVRDRRDREAKLAEVLRENTPREVFYE